MTEEQAEEVRRRKIADLKFVLKRCEEMKAADPGGDQLEMMKWLRHELELKWGR